MTLNRFTLSLFFHFVSADKPFAFVPLATGDEICGILIIDTLSLTLPWSQVWRTFGSHQTERRMVSLINRGEVEHREAEEGKNLEKEKGTAVKTNRFPS